MSVVAETVVLFLANKHLYPLCFTTEIQSGFRRAVVIHI